MTKYHYHLLDVFTNQPFGGNQLAVFADAQAISPALMPRIARELNLSETTFVLPPQNEDNDFWVRIFTPAMELPMAGHPTVGTAFALAREGAISGQDGPVTVRFEEGVGVVPVTLHFENGRPTRAFMQQPLPAFGPSFPDREAAAAALSLTTADLSPDHPLEVASSGVPFLFVPLRNLDAIRRASLRHDLWEQHFQAFAGPHLFLFTMETETAVGHMHCRMFAPAMGIAEDPATGAASGPLGAYLVRYGLVPMATRVAIVSEQGFEMGRPSLIQVEIEQQDGEITAVAVGGESVYMGQGYLEV